MNLHALVREQLLRHDWEDLPGSMAALLSAQVCTNEWPTHVTGFYFPSKLSCMHT